MAPPLPDGASAEQILADPSLEACPQLPVTPSPKPRATAYFGLENVAPEAYAACFAHVPDGIPHVTRGIIAEITVG